MTPASAAQILELSIAATPQEIEAAYRRRSRASHPDRFAGQPSSVTRAAAEEFVRITEARETLLRTVVDRGGDPNAAVPLPYAGYEVRSRPRRSWIAFGVWTALLLVALVLSVLDDTAALSGADIALRLIPLAVATIAFALTGRRAWLVIALIFAAITVGFTLAFASFGPLLSLEILLVPLLGLGAIGLGQLRRRASAGGQSSGAANQGG